MSLVVWIKKPNQWRPLGRCGGLAGSVVDGPHAPISKEDVLAVEPPPRQWPGLRRWFWLQHGAEQVHPTMLEHVRRPSVTCLVASAWWQREIEARGGRAVVTGLPHLDWLPEIPRTKDAWRTVLYLPLPKQFGRARQWLWAARVVARTRRHEQRLALNVRPKDGCPPWLRRMAAVVGVDDERQPPSILVRLQDAILLWHHDSCAALEGTAAQIGVQNLGSPLYNPLPARVPLGDLCGPVGGNTERVLEACGG